MASLSANFLNSSKGFQQSTLQAGRPNLALFAVVNLRQSASSADDAVSSFLPLPIYVTPH
jgi:hypothetical protein